MTETWLAGGRTLIDGTLHPNLAVQIQNGAIAAIQPVETLDPDAPITRLRKDQCLLPGLIDIQVNGGGGHLFNDNPAMLPAIAHAHHDLGVSAIMPTLITSEPALMRRAAEEVLAYRGHNVIGLHYEGPFLSPARPGIHNPALIRPMQPEDVAFLTAVAASLAPRRLLVTLAPEETPDDALTQLAQAGVIVAIGHTTASYERCQQALRLGVRGFTHLWNAMPAPAARAPGPVIAALESNFCGLIADLIHVHPANLRATLAANPNAFLVSDSMSVAGTELAEFTLQSKRIRRAEGRLVDATNTLAGADLDLRKAVENVRTLGVSLARTWSMASEIPAKFLGLQDRGRIAVGQKAEFVVL